MKSSVRSPARALARGARHNVLICWATRFFSCCAASGPPVGGTPHVGLPNVRAGPSDVRFRQPDVCSRAVSITRPVPSDEFALDGRWGVSGRRSPTRHRYNFAGRPLVVHSGRVSEPTGSSGDVGDPARTEPSSAMHGGLRARPRTTGTDRPARPAIASRRLRGDACETTARRELSLKPLAIFSSSSRHTLHRADHQEYFLKRS